MFFPFTFSLNTPFTNPFDPPAPASAADPGQLDYESPQRTRARRPPPPRRPIPQPSPERSGISRKRGRWSPEAKTRACSPVADLTSTASAYIDTHGKSTDFTNDRTDLDSENVQNELRPVKRRRIVEITDSLISTAFSAAVIGTAVGLTAYRLWRDRGKDGLPSTPGPDPALEGFPPPPPYTERPERTHMQPTAGPSYVPGGVVPAPAPTSTPVNRRTKARPNTTGRRPQVQSARRRRPVSTVYPRNQSPAVSLHRPATSYHTAPNSARNTPGPSASTPHDAADAQSGDELDDSEMEMSGQMDWMSSQLRNLINEGKKALGTEVVVGGADEADDGADGWEEDEPVVTPSRAYSTASSGATRTVARPATGLGRSTSRTSNVARVKNPHQRSSSGASMRKAEDYEDEHGFEVLYQTPLRSAPATKTTFTSTDDGTSEELRVAMERVRKAYGLR